jgi:hypothetical protein
MHRSREHRYSITAVAATSNVCGTERPRALAVLRLIIGYSAGDFTLVRSI